MILRIICSLLFGFISAIFFAERDPLVKDYLAKTCMDMFNASMGCCMHCRVARLDILRATVDLEDVVVTPVEENPHDWFWTCNHYRITISPLVLLRDKILSMSMDLCDLEATSVLRDKDLAIVPHIQKLVTFSTAVALELKELSLHNVFLKAHDAAAGNGMNLIFNAYSLVAPEEFRTSLTITHGSCTYHDILYAHSVTGTAVIRVPSGQKSIQDAINGNMDFACRVPLIPGSDKHVKGTLSYDHKRMTIKVADTQDMLRLGPVTLSFIEQGVGFAGTAYAPVRYIRALLPMVPIDSLLNGSVGVRLYGASKYDGDIILLKGSITGYDIQYAGHQIASKITTHLTNKRGLWQGRVNASMDTGLTCTGLWYFDQHTKKGHISIENETSLAPFRHTKIHVDPHDALLDVHIDHQTVRGTYNTAITGILSDPIPISGLFSMHHGALEAHGLCGDYAYTIAGMPLQKRLQRLSIANKDRKVIIDINERSKTRYSYQGIVDIADIKPYLKRWIPEDIQAEGKCALRVTYDKGCIILQSKLVDGIIRIPKTYSCISGFELYTLFDPSSKSIQIPRIKLTLQEGSITSKHGLLQFNDRWCLDHLYIPLSIHKCLCSIKKDISGFITGDLTITKDLGASALIKGKLSIDEGSVAVNIFSRGIRDMILGSTGGMTMHPLLDANLDIAVETYTPIKIKTFILDAEARLNITVQGRLQQPSIKGSINIQSGQLMFPFKPLNITRAFVSLTPDNLKEPYIDFVAQNRIKKYAVNIRAKGSLQSPYLTLESSPPLSNEQIIGLLLVGSEEESLISAIPGLVVQNLPSLLFGSEQVSSMHKYFSILLKPLKHIHFIPGFSDQTGRGGLRGTIQVDINDRWRALIQKNFNLSEDTRFEMEYMLSDDISIKAGRDEHRDINSEVELRWKF